MDQILTTVLQPRHGEHHDASTPTVCESGNEYDGNIGLRISAVFVILVGSSLGALFPILARRDPGSNRKHAVPSWVFFVAKFFGSGVIIATSFIHLLAPAHAALGHPCLDGPITEYSWVEGIILMTIIVLFFVELMVMRYARFGEGHHDEAHGHADDNANTDSSSSSVAPEKIMNNGTHNNRDVDLEARPAPANPISHIHGVNHLNHSHDHPSDDGSNPVDSSHAISFEDYAAQLTSVFILEFGIIFHSIFIGLTLAVAGAEFKTLYIVLVFHQTFEGLGLGSRLATIPWPRPKRFTPYWLAIGFGLSTPIAIAVGLGVRNSYPPGGRTTLIVNGVFDSISAGILIYTSLVELMAHEFMFSTSMRRAPLRTVLSAFGLLCLGALLMALIGKWA